MSLDTPLDLGDCRLVDAPPPARAGGKTSAARGRMIAFAKAHPGRWVQYRPDPKTDRGKPESIRNAAIKGNSGGFQGGRWDATVRAAEGRTSVYVRYLGPTGATALRGAS